MLFCISVNSKFQDSFLSVVMTVLWKGVMVYVVKTVPLDADAHNTPLQSTSLFAGILI